MGDWEAPTYTISMKQITNEDLLRVDMQELSMSKFLGRNHRPIYLGVYLFVFFSMLDVFSMSDFFLIGNSIQ